MPGSLALVLDAADYDAIVASGNSVDSLVACDPEIHVELRRRGVAHRTPWDLIDAARFDALRRTERELIAFWREHAHAPCDGVNLLACADFRHAGALSRILWCHAIVDGAMRHARPDRVIVIEQPSRHGLSQPPEVRTFPLLQSMLAGRAAGDGVVVTRCATRAPQAAFDDTVARRREQPHASRRDDADRLTSRRFILVHGNGIDLDRQRELAAAIRARCDLPLVHLHRDSTVDRVAALDTLFDYAWNEAQFAQPADSMVVAALARDASRQWSTAVQHAPRTIRDVLSNPGLDAHFDFIFGDYLARMADHAATWTRFLDRHRPAALVTHYQTPILDIAVAKGIPALILPHGANMDFPQWYSGMPACRIGALSETHRDALVGAGVDSSRTAITGDPWLGRARAARIGEGAKRDLGLPGDRPLVLLCTSQLGWLAKNESLPQTQWRGAIETLLEIRGLADRRPQWQFALKCHPRYDHHELYPQLFSGGGVIPIYCDESIYDVAAAADVVVFANVHSSAMIECAALGVPTLLLCDQMPGFDFDRTGLSRWPLVRSVARLERTLDLMLRSKQVRTDEIEKTRLGLAHYLRGTPTDPLAAAAALAVELAQSNATQPTTRSVRG
ncbi:MAG: hypothetical protein ACKVS9_11680 [Phycisphaerae bacterium]